LDGLERRERELAEALVGHFTTKFVHPSWNSENDTWAGELAAGYGVQNRILEHNSTCDLLGETKFKIKVTPEFIAEYDAHTQWAMANYKAREAKRNSPEYTAQREANRLKRLAGLARKNQKQIDAWLAGQGGLTDAVRDLHPQVIRVQGDVVQTSRGAEVPLSHAIRLMKLIDGGKLRQGERVGHFTFDSIETHVRDSLQSELVVKIGCHKISYAQAKQVLQAVPARLTLVENETETQSQTQGA
jgi:hypothetical protein